MKKFFLVANLSVTFSFLTTTTTFLQAQIVVNSAVTPTQMVNNLVGTGVTFSNVTFTGDAVSRGTFTNGNTTNLGMTSGVVLTTGNLADVPVNNGSSTTYNNSGPAIPELQTIANVTATHDGAILEFDFIPLSNTINVRYIFGSEEYSEYVNSVFNDAFAFYISGPGITGQQNIAVVPSTTIPVTINTINNGSTSTASPCPGGSGPNGPCTNCAYYFENCGSSGANSIEYDGFTTQLIATRTVIPCSTYHIKLMIADGGDYQLDSGVFIEENGFYSTGAMTDVSAVPAYGLGAAVEGCNGSQFVFTMPNVLPTNATFNYTVGGTATPGVDYVAIPSSITIPAGQTTAVLPINVLNDVITEGTETITLTVQISPCSTQTFTMNIVDPTPINVSATNAAFCQGAGPVNISANATGGDGTVSYSWNNGAGNGTPVSVNPATTTTYTVTATDQCGRSNTATSTVTVTPLPTSSFTVNSPICLGNPASVTYTGNAGAGAQYAWNFGGGTASPGGTSQGPHTVTYGSAGNYNLSLSVTENGCTSAPGNQSLTVISTPVTPTIGSNSPVCSGGTINLTANTIPGATYVWTGPGFNSNLEDPTRTGATAAMAGTYTLYVVVNGCTSATASTVVNVNPTPAAPVIGSNTPVCQGNALNLTCNTIPGATYVWSGPNGFSSNLEDPTLNPATTAMTGTYNAYVVVSGCTSATANTPVVVNPTPAAPVIASNSPVCSGNPLNLTANTIPGVTYVWSGPNGFTSSDEDPTLNPATTAMTGTYSAYVVALGCTSATSNTAVTVNQTPATPNAASNTPVCSGNPLNLTTDNIPGATYEWAGPNGFSSSVQNPSIPAATVAATGTYSLYTVVTGCTSATASTPVVVNPTPAAPVIASNSPVCSGNPLNLTSNTIPGVTYVWSGPNGFSSNLEDPTLNPSTVAMTGTYSAYVVALGCTSATSNTAVTVNQTPATPNVASNTPVCSGNALNLTTGTVPGATYVWSGPNGFTSSDEDPSIPAATVAATGTYSLYTVVTGCPSATASTPVVVNPTPAAPVISSNTPVCEGGNIDLTANTIPGATYVWSGPNGFSSSSEDPTLSPAALAMGGNYSAYVVVTGCPSATANTPVVVNPTPAAPVIASNTPVCEGSDLNLTSNTIPGATYVWTGPNGFSSSDEDPSIPAATVAASGSYSAYVVVLGCASPVSSHDATVNPIPAAPVIASNTPVCEGGSINLTANTVAGATYVWSGPNGYTSSDEDPSISPATIANAGNYNAYVVALGCTSATATTPVAVNLVPAAPSIGSNSPICESGTINLTSNTINAATYVWSGPNGFSSSDEDPTLTPATLAMGGNYEAYVVVAGCTSSTANIQVVVNATPQTPIIGSNGPLCLGEILELTANTINGATYHWTGPNGFSSNDEDPTAVADDLNMAGNYSLYLEAAGCMSDTATTSVQIVPLPTADFAVTPQVCLGNDAFALYNGNAPSNAIYDWAVTGGGTTSGSGQGPINITWGSAGTHYMTLTVTQNGCSSLPVTHSVNIIAPVIPDAGPDQTACSGSVLNIGTQNATGATFTWTTPNGITDVNSAYTTGTWSNNGNDAITMTITLQSDNQGCIATDDAVITIVPYPVANFTAPAAQCFSANSFNFTAGGSFMPSATFNWAFENANIPTSYSQNPSGVSFHSPGTNDVTLTITQSGCESAPFTLPVTVAQGPQAAFSELPVQGCVPMVVHFTDQSTSTAGGITYSWDFGHGSGSTEANPSHTYTQTGVYSVTLSIEDATGCSSSVTKTNIIRVYEQPEAGFYVNPTEIYIDEPFTNVNDGSTGNVVSWNYSISNGAHFTVPSFTTNFSDTGYYSITQTVANQFGCTSEFTLQVHVRPVTEIFIPNAFTPNNNDNINNTFKPSGINFKGYQMYIYNRWGEMLFSTQDVNEGWDGTVRNSSTEAKQDLYVYKIIYVDHRGNEQQALGNVMVLR